jgi:hypothetical protein
MLLCSSWQENVKFSRTILYIQSVLYLLLPVHSCVKIQRQILRCAICELSLRFRFQVSFVVRFQAEVVREFWVCNLVAFWQHFVESRGLHLGVSMFL